MARVVPRAAPAIERFPDFALLYGAIGDAMTAVCDDAEASGAVGIDAAAWFRALLVDFQRAFDAWGDGSPPCGVDDYLVALDRHPRLVRLAGHVFLHIAVDLPMVIRESFDAHPRVERATMRAVYLRPARVLHVDVMRAKMHGQRVRRLLARVVGGRSLETLAHWVQTMRATAWIHAELAHDAALPAARLEAALVAALRAALRSLDAGDDASAAFAGSEDVAHARRHRRPQAVLGVLRQRRSIERFARAVQWRVADALLMQIAGSPLQATSASTAGRRARV